MSMEQLTTTYAIRNGRKRKIPFLRYAQEEFAALGYTAHIQQGKTMGVRCENLVVGDVHKASVIVAAHYDTPRTMLLPVRNYLNRVGASIFFQLLPILLIFAVDFAASVLLELPVWASFLIAYVMVYVLMLCFKNKHNANDNSSGVMGVYETAKHLPEEMRGRVAFVLFDNEEWGMLGALAFAAEYETRSRFVVVMDCIGVGEPRVLYKKKDEISARKLAGKHMEATAEKTNLYMSDNKVFTSAVLISAFKKDGIGNYLDKIHTNGDTKADEETIKRVATMTRSFICDHAN